MDSTDVRGTLRDMWETRPARPRRDRQLGGVSTAIARRYDLDPVLVRVGFVVTMLLGIGALLYVAGWIVLPEEPPDPAAPVPVRSPRAVLAVGLAIGVLAGVFTVASFSFVVPAVATAILLYLLHRGRGERVRHLGVPIRHARPDGAGSPDRSAPTGQEYPADPTVAFPATRTPPAWDPLGAAPFAWDLPEPTPLPVVGPSSRRPPVTAVTLGFGLLGGGVMALVLLISGAFTLPNLPLVFGAVLAVLGTGLVVGSFVRAGRGLIPVALILGLLTWGLVAAPLDTLRGDGGVGELTAEPRTTAAVLPRYAQSAGEINLDLRGLDLSVPAGVAAPPLPIEVEVGVGEVSILVPRDADLRVAAAVGFGEVRVEGTEQSGPNVRIVTGESLGADGVRSGRLLVLDVRARVGDVQVHRG